MDINPNEQQDTAPVTPAPSAPVTPVQPPAVTPEPAPRPQPRSKKWLMWAVPLGIIIVAALFVAGYYLGTQKNDDQSAAAVVDDKKDTVKESDDETKEDENTQPAPVDAYAGWQSSEDIPNLGPKETFSYKYPASWKVMQPGEGVSPCRFISPDATRWSSTATNVCIGTDSYGGRPIGKIAGAWLREGATIASSRNVTIDGHNAFQIVSTPWTDDDGTVKTSIITIVENVNRGSGYGEEIGVLHALATFVGDQSNFEAFNQQYQLIIESLKFS